MIETAEIVHHVPGRMRLRLAFAKGDAARLEAVRSALASLPGVSRVEASPLLGSILIYYDSTLFPHFAGALQNHATQYELFALACEDSEPCVSETHRSIRRALTDVNRVVQKALGNSINLKELLPIGAALYGFLFVDKNAAAAQWLNWLQFAFDTYIDLHEEQPITELSQKIDTMGAHILEGQAKMTDSLRADLAALRAELQTLAERLPVPQAP